MSFDELHEAAPYESEQVGFEVDMSKLSSATLSRLVEEVKNDEMLASSYDRAHNRHNR